MPSRYAATMAYDAGRRRIAIAGGTVLFRNAAVDTWQWIAFDPNQACPTP